jgi:hypothetical protein
MVVDLAGPFAASRNFPVVPLGDDILPTQDGQMFG